MTEQLNPRIDAYRYILIGLIQRLEQDQPGLLTDMIEGAKGDHEMSDPPLNRKAHINQVFTEAIATLELAKAQLDED